MTCRRRGAVCAHLLTGTLILILSACGTTSIAGDAICGNDVIESGEVCDGENLSGLTCQTIGLYGGTLACQSDCAAFDTSGCTVSLCGNAVLDPGETCDDGADNSDTEPNACRTDCTQARCGDGVADTGEACDEGENNNDTAPDACRTNCVGSKCGDGTIDDFEACDDGADNSDIEPNACRTNCTQSYCGDDVLDTAEVCDNGVANSDTAPNACRTNCHESSCGDAVVDAGEACDEGENNSNTVPDACRTNCVGANCGDGVLDDFEACDDGPSNSDTEPDACRTICVPAFCGDEVIDASDLCDDGADNNDADADACRTNCMPATCGDGVIDASEICDDAENNSDTDADACRTNCVPASCGDGTVDSSETCDNGADNSDTDPNACRTNCVPASCGDGTVDSGETCDDGADNGVPLLNACGGTCQPTSKYELVLTMQSDGLVTAGSWTDAENRVANELQDCVVRFDNRIATARHIELETDRIRFDFQPLTAWHDGWDGYAYVELALFDRAGVGTSYRRSASANVWMRDAAQHIESTWTGFEVSMYCERDSAYAHVASLDAAGAVTSGSWSNLVDMVTQRAARCKVRYDDRISLAPHMEYGAGWIYFDFLGLHARHNSWDGYAYIHLAEGSRAGIASTYRRGTWPTVSYRDRSQHGEAERHDMAVDVYCQDVFTDRFELDSSGTMVTGTWANLHAAVVDEMRDCRVQYDDRISDPEYIEYSSTTLEFNLMNLHAWHNSWDAYAAVRLSEGAHALIDSNFRRGDNTNVWRKSAAQHGWYGAATATSVIVHCEQTPTLHRVLIMTSSGAAAFGDWDDFYGTLLDPASAHICRSRQDDRILMPPHLEHGAAGDDLVYLDMIGLTAYWSGWDAYAFVMLDKGNPTGLSASYRRGNASYVGLRDRAQNSGTYAVQAHPVELFCH
jgi:hypothetical protein